MQLLRRRAGSFSKLNLLAGAQKMKFPIQTSSKESKGLVRKTAVSPHESRLAVSLLFLHPSSHFQGIFFLILLSLQIISSQDRRSGFPVGWHSPLADCRHSVLGKMKRHWLCSEVAKQVGGHKLSPWLHFICWAALRCLSLSPSLPPFLSSSLCLPQPLLPSTRDVAGVLV